MDRTTVPLLVLLAACAPNNAELVNGRYMAFISDRTSLSLAKESLDPKDYPESDYWKVDCREFENKADRESLQLDGAIDICTDRKKWPPVYEEWEGQAGFHVVTEEMHPWRGEAVITSEGDLQIGFHHRVPGGGDFRLMLSVDPDFAPQTCIQDPVTKQTQRVPKDGDWIGEWSADQIEWIKNDKNKFPTAFSHMEDYLDYGARLYFLNAFSHQFNPQNTDNPDWDVPSEWVAGASEGKFVEEDVFHRPARYGDPRAYNLIELSGSTETQYISLDEDDLWWCDLDPGTNPREEPCMQELDDETHAIQRDIHNELQAVMVPPEAEEATPPRDEWDPLKNPKEPKFDYAPLIHMNYWREPDGLPAGFDGWAEMHYNYVIFSEDSDLSPGGSASGAFSVVLDADQSQTRVFVQGEFKIDRIKNDSWTTENLAENKLIEADETLCSAGSEQEADPVEAEEEEEE